MRYFITILFLLNSLIGKCQITSGEYDSDLKIAFNLISKQVTGFFSNYAGYDEATGNAGFSCIF
jgi:hypothetical protein